MNWDRRLKRITLILSIVGALIGAGFYYYLLTVELRFYEKALERERRAKLVDNDGSYLIREWKKTDTRHEQINLWKRWTGSSLNLRPYEPNKPQQTFEQLNLTGEEQQLKAQGWIATTGEPLPLTPMGVRNIRHNRTVKGVEEKIQRQRKQLPKALVLGSLIGFSVLWAFYAVIMWVALPLYKWIYIGETLPSQSNQTSSLPTQGQMTTKLKVNYNANSQNEYHEKSEIITTKIWQWIGVALFTIVVVICVLVTIFEPKDVLLFGGTVASFVAIWLAVRYCNADCPKCGKKWAFGPRKRSREKRWSRYEKVLHRCRNCGYEEERKVRRSLKFCNISLKCRS